MARTATALKIFKFDIIGSINGIFLGHPLRVSQPDRTAVVPELRGHLKN
jgi:hypothetical protein